MEKTEAFGAVILICLAGVAGYYFTQNAAKQKKRMELLNQAHDLQGAYARLLSDDQAWEKTLLAAENSTFACFFSDSEDCSPEKDPQNPRTFAIRDAKGAAVYDGASARSGFTPAGAACDSYPSEQCPLHWKVSWLPKCAETPCKRPLVELRAELQCYALPGEPNPLSESAFVATAQQIPPAGLGPMVELCRKVKALPNRVEVIAATLKQLKEKGQGPQELSVVDGFLNRYCR